METEKVINRLLTHALQIHTELSFRKKTAIIVRDGWLEDVESSERFPNLQTWVVKIARQEGKKELVKNQSVVVDLALDNVTVLEDGKRPRLLRDIFNEKTQWETTFNGQQFLSLKSSPTKSPTKSSPSKFKKSPSPPKKTTKKAKTTNKKGIVDDDEKEEEKESGEKSVTVTSSVMEDVSMLMNMDREEEEDDDSTMAPSDDEFVEPDTSNKRKRKEPPTKKKMTKKASTTPTKKTKTSTSSSPTKKARRTSLDVTSSELSEPQDTQDHDMDLEPQVVAPTTPVRRRSSPPTRKISPTSKASSKRSSRVLSSPSSSEETQPPTVSSPTKATGKGKEKEEDADATVAPSDNSPPGSPSLEFVDVEDLMHDHSAYLSELRRITSAAESKKTGDESTAEPSVPLPPPSQVSAKSSSPSKQQAVTAPRSSSSSPGSPSLLSTTPPSQISVSSTKHAVILTTGLRSQMISHIQLLVEKLGGRLVDTYVPQVTHVVTLVDSKGYTKRTIKFCEGVLAGAWVVTFDWIMASFQKGAWVSEEPFEVKGDVIAASLLGDKGNIPRLARTGLASPSSPEERLFKGYRFFFAGDFGQPSKEDLLTLVDVGHGFVCSQAPSPPKTTKEMMSSQQWNTLVICDPDRLKGEEEAREVFFKTGKLPISVRWLLDSISFYKRLRPEDYYIITEAKARRGETPTGAGGTGISQTQMSQDF